MQQNSRLKFVDAAKGFTILLLVFYHTVNGYWRTNTYTENAEFNYVVSNVVCSFIVSLFYFLSGILFDKAYIKDDKLVIEKWLKQVVNIVLLYVVYEIIYISLKSLVPGQVADPVSIGDIKYIWRWSYGPYWYLYYLFFFYLIFAIPYIRKINNIIVIVVLCAMAILQEKCIYALCFYLGMNCNKNEKSWLYNYKTGTICAVIYVVVAVLFWNRESLLLDTRIVSVVCAVSATLFISSYFMKFEQLYNNRFLNFIGKNTMEIFLWHQPIIMVCRVLLIKIGVTSELIAIIITILFAVGIPVGFTILTGKNLIYNLAFRQINIVYNIFGKIRRYNNEHN